MRTDSWFLEGVATSLRAGQAGARGAGRRRARDVLGQIGAVVRCGGRAADRALAGLVAVELTVGRRAVASARPRGATHGDARAGARPAAGAAAAGPPARRTRAAAV